MPYVTIARIVPADIQQVQAQTTNDADISEVIESLQFNRQTALGSTLNTACPTCLVGDVSLGFLNTEVSGETVYYACPACLGYCRIHTAEGGLTPPSNPFGSPLVVDRLLPADLLQAMNGFEVTTLDTLVTSLQGNIYDSEGNNISLDYDCPLCEATGWIEVQGVDVFCRLCNGEQKTHTEYQLSGGVISPVVPSVDPPDPPLPVPPYPPEE